METVGAAIGAVGSSWGNIGKDEKEKNSKQSLKNQKNNELMNNFVLYAIHNTDNPQYNTMATIQYNGHNTIQTIKTKCVPNCLASPSVGGINNTCLVETMNN